MAELRRYSKYEHPELPWLGRIPAHWEVRKLRHILEEVTERNRPDLPLLSVVREKGVIQRDIASQEENRNFIPDDLSNYKVVRAGQFAMNKMKAWQGSYGVSQHDGIVSPAYFVFRLKEVQGHFFHLAIRSRAYVPFFAQASDGVRIGQWDLAQWRMREIPFFLPPLPEQIAIISFLRYANGRVERAIQAKKKLIALLNEQKQAIIHRAVTRGLDPDVSLKSSGIPWLGDIPQHWDITPLKYLAHNIQNGSTPSSDSPEYFASGTIPWYGPGAISAALEVGQPTRFVTEKAIRDGEARLIKGPALLVVVIGTVGKMGLMIGKGTTNQQITAFELRKDVVDGHFLACQLKSAEPWLNAAASSATIPIIDSGFLGRSGVALPKLPEQQKILHWIASNISPLNAAESRLDREIELLREYRRRLVADVVTGKLDVREAAKSLPSEPEEQVVEPEEQIAIEATSLDEE